jgi:hypothetical protein
MYHLTMAYPGRKMLCVNNLRRPLNNKNNCSCDAKRSLHTYPGRASANNEKAYIKKFRRGKRLKQEQELKSTTTEICYLMRAGDLIWGEKIFV